MRTLMLAFALAACAPVLTPPDRPLTAAEARGIEMLHRLRALDPCHRECACHTDAQPPRQGLPYASLRGFGPHPRLWATPAPNPAVCGATLPTTMDNALPRWADPLSFRGWVPMAWPRAARKRTNAGTGPNPPE